MASVLPFSLNWYLSQNPDVAEAVSKGLIGAFEHFELYGKVEGRSANPLFNTAEYLDKNADVAAAVARGEITAYDHFVTHGAGEGRSPLALFDEAFYLLQNPDVAQAVEAGAMTAVQHFLMYGQSEPRPFNAFIDLGEYLKANPDVAQAVEGGFVTAMGHLMTYGAHEPRDLGNGVHLADFAKDPAFSDALAAGNFAAALGRVGDVAPFLPTFEKPAGWIIPANTQIPTGFVPVEGKHLVIPEGFKVPEGTKLPEIFKPVTPVVPPVTPPGSGGGGSGETFSLRTELDNITGTAGNDTFLAQAGTLQSFDILDGGAGNDVLVIAAGAFDNRATPHTRNIEIISNSHLGAAIAGHKNAVSLGLADVKGLEKLWTDFSNISWIGKELPIVRFGTNGVGVFYDNASAPTVFGISGVGPQGKDTSPVGSASISFNGAGGTLNLALKDNKAGSYYKAGASDKFKAVNIDVAEGNSGTIAITDTVESITITGAGNLAFLQRNFSELTTFTTSDATGDIVFGGKTGVGGEYGTIGLGEEFSMKTGSGHDQIDFSSWFASSTTKTINIDTGEGDDNIKLTLLASLEVVNINAGAGNDVITVNFGDAVSKAKLLLIGGEGDDRFEIVGSGGSFGSIDGGGGTDTLSLAGKHLGAEDYTSFNNAVKNVEILEFTGGTAAVVDASKLAFTGYTFTGNPTDKATEASSVALTTKGALEAAATGYKADDRVAVDGDVLTDAYGGVLNITSTAGTNAAVKAFGSEVNLNVKAGAAAATSVVLTGDAQTAKVTLTNNGSVVADDQLASVNIVITAAPTTNGTAVNGNSYLTSLTLSGNGSAVVDNAPGNKLATIDASGLGGTYAFGADAGNVTDGLTFTGSATVAESITLGSGKDVLTVNSTYGKLDTITGFDAKKETADLKSVTDIIKIGAKTLDGTGVGQATKVALSASATSVELAFVEAAAATTGTDVSFFQLGGNTYLFQNQGAAGLEADDFAVKIVGLVDFAAAWGEYTAV